MYNVQFIDHAGDTRQVSVPADSAADAAARVHQAYGHLVASEDYVVTR